jgi:hypothetical protein
MEMGIGINVYVAWAWADHSKNAKSPFKSKTLSAPEKIYKPKAVFRDYELFVGKQLYYPFSGA